MARFALSVAVVAALVVSVAPALGHLDAPISIRTALSCDGLEPRRSGERRVHGVGHLGSDGEPDRGARGVDVGDRVEPVLHRPRQLLLDARPAGELASARYHVRVRGQHQDAALGWVAVVGAHHEDLVLVPIPCGHAVDSNGPSGSGFDQGRNELERRFAVPGHPTSRVWWGNTQSFKQCDGDYAASDGWTVFVALTR